MKNPKTNEIHPGVSLLSGCDAETAIKKKQSAAIVLLRFRRKGFRVRLDRDSRGFRVTASTIPLTENDNAQIDMYGEEILEQLRRERDERRAKSASRKSHANSD